MEQIEKEERIHFSTRDSAAPTRQTEIGCAYISRSSCIKKKRKKNFLSSTQIFLPTSRTAIRNRREREKAIWSVEGRNAKKSGTRHGRVRKCSCYVIRQAVVIVRASRYEWGRKSTFVHIYELRYANASRRNVWLAYTQSIVDSWIDSEHFKNFSAEYSFTPVSITLSINFNLGLTYFLSFSNS